MLREQRSRFRVCSRFKPSIRAFVGVLGQNFLAHFDVLVDYRRNLLWLDEANRMRLEVRGERIPLVTAKRPGDQPTA